MTDKFRQTLKDHDVLTAHDPYIVHLNRQLNFRHSDPTVAYIETERMPNEDFPFGGAGGEGPAPDDFYAFDHHYLRYAQIIDTDYENYMIMYSCQEGAQYFNPGDKGDQAYPIEDLDDIWKHVKRQPNPARGESHMLTAYEVGEGIIQKPLHKERVQILWRVPTGKDEVAAEAGPPELDAEQLNVHM